MMSIPKSDKGCAMAFFDSDCSLSRSLISSSMDIVATTWRNWPMMISFSWLSRSPCIRLPRRTAAFCITFSSLETAKVTFTGKLTLMFCLDRPFSNLTSKLKDSMLTIVYPWMTGHTKQPPPWMHLPGPLSFPILPYTIRSSFGLHFLYLVNRRMIVVTTTKPTTAAMISTLKFVIIVKFLMFLLFVVF